MPVIGNSQSGDTSSVPVGALTFVSVTRQLTAAPSAMGAKRKSGPGKEAPPSAKKKASPAGVDDASLELPHAKIFNAWLPGPCSSVRVQLISVAGQVLAA